MSKDHQRRMTSSIPQIIQAKRQVFFKSRSTEVRPDVVRPGALKFMVLFILLPALAFGQQDSLRKRPDVLRFADGVIYTYTAPARWDGKDLLKFGGLLAGTTVLALVDQPVQEFWQRHDNRFLDGVERVGYHYGKPYSAITFTAGFYLAGMIFKSEWAKDTGLMLGTTLFTSNFIMGILKEAVGRARPSVTDDNLVFKPFSNSAAYHSFPSGHSSVAFGITVVLAKRIDNLPLKILFYSLAGTTVVSRMYSDSHWLSDMGFGGMFAWFCADTAISRIQENRFRKVRHKDKLVWNVYPYPGGLTVRGIIQ